MCNNVKYIDAPMISYCSKNTVLLLLLLGATCWVRSQTEFTLEKVATLQYNISPRWSTQLGTEYRNTPAEDIGDASLQFNSRHLQFSGTVAYEVGFYAKLGTGIMYRFNTLEDKGNENETRITQQYTYAKPYNALRLGHRLKLDQRIKVSETTHRMRYRLSADAPLNGLSVDRGEYYGVASLETLLNISRLNKPAWDQRFTLGIGNQIFEKVKLQIDVQYRVEDFFSSNTQSLFVVTQLYYKL
ncbi:uncharacterized protein DUF2490 [Marinirhabdus gelatinilytica]|uniref:Uncharacterized protein DUF2490 n=1 Tax=Marinirhabdus gelatinilytica TaxID=1703343 RepID=A0A370QKC4_9FLAO|nr:uncharacterized protein DUF2490 [Marinirhabdus gelatinilytica]